ncbi:hypothetical protein [Sponge holobiont-associated RNA virus]|nr:hypothetical protein [Sponge holobiont-associated RNA virus]
MTSAVTISVNDSIATYGLSGSFSFNGMDFKFKNFEIKVVILTTGRVSTSKDVILGLLSAIDTYTTTGVKPTEFIVKMEKDTSLDIKIARGSLNITEGQPKKEFSCVSSPSDQDDDDGASTVLGVIGASKRMSGVLKKGKTRTTSVPVPDDEEEVEDKPSAAADKLLKEYEAKVKEERERQDLEDRLAEAEERLKQGFHDGLGVPPPSSSVFVTREESLARKSGISVTDTGSDTSPTSSASTTGWSSQASKAYEIYQQKQERLRKKEFTPRRAMNSVAVPRTASRPGTSSYTSGDFLVLALTKPFGKLKLCDDRSLCHAIYFDSKNEVSFNALKEFERGSLFLVENQADEDFVGMNQMTVLRVDQLRRGYEDEGGRRLHDQVLLDAKKKEEVVLKRSAMNMYQQAEAKGKDCLEDLPVEVSQYQSMKNNFTKFVEECLKSEHPPVVRNTLTRQNKLTSKDWLVKHGTARRSPHMIILARGGNRCFEMTTETWAGPTSVVTVPIGFLRSNLWTMVGQNTHVNRQNGLIEIQTPDRKWQPHPAYQFDDQSNYGQ